jgi:hypothetical protein
MMDAWKAVKRNKGAAGVDRITVKNIMRNGKKTSQIS